MMCVRVKNDGDWWVNGLVRRSDGSCGSVCGMSSEWW